MAENSTILLEKRGVAFWITLNRPEKRNAINHDVIDGIREGYHQAHADPEVQVIVLAGTGEKAFCAGADLQPGRAFAFDHYRPNTDYADLLRFAWNSKLPSISRVNGVCMAGGLGLLRMTDMAVATVQALFGLPEVKVGVFPMQVLSLLQHLVPQRVLREWCFTGGPFDAETALRHGLINYVVPTADLDRKTQWLVERLTDNSPPAIRRGKYAMRAMASMSFDEGIAYTESQIALLALTEDAKEGLAAFSERRKPVGTGR